MTTHSDTTSIDSRAAASVESRRSRTYTIALWTLQVLVAAFLFFSAVMKLTGAEEMVALFDAIGIGQWFRYVTGSIQIVGTVLLVVPKLAPLGALVLASTMGGAVLTHLFVIGGSALVPFALFVVLLGIVWACRSQFASLLSR